ncbi:MAG TPA: cytidylate kinase [Cyanobacteria bacterium UBA11049]|nr:cytidylate kinase [Cyanobacteria bacterium UBA11049]
MRLFTTVAALRCYLSLCRIKNSHLGQEEWNSTIASLCQKTVGLVPTMGALHQGHLSLIQRARQENDTVIVSIFVNPLQFGPTEDYQRYPRALDRDRQLCEQAGVDVIFAPTPEEMGMGQGDKGDKEAKHPTPHNAPGLKLGNPPTILAPSHPAPLTQVVPPPEMTSVLCGRSRLGHFQGVATIVTKLLNLVQPDRAYFGQKDAQQLAIIKRLVQDLNIPVEIVGCPTVREASGLAMSSRNQYLTTEEKQHSTLLYRGLQRAKQAFEAGERSNGALIAAVKQELAASSAVQIEYVELVHPTTLMPLEQVEELGMVAIAARLGAARLIDNIILRDRPPIVAIDGPAGAGKSTVARLVAKQLGLLYLDTGAMYRALTWLVLQLEIPFEDECAIAELASKCQIQLAPSADLEQPVRVWINEQEVTQEIRSLQVTSRVSAIAAQSAVRQVLVKKQQHWGQKGGLVAEGRDIGTNVFPDAEVKIFLTASVPERAKRRQQDFQAQGQMNVSLEQLEQDIAARDWKDSTRDIAPLQKAADAIEIQTDGKTVAQVTDEIVNYYHQVLSRNH